MNLKILISTRFSIFELEGTTIRAKHMLNVLKDYFDVYLITTGKNDYNKSNISNYYVIEPKTTRLWSFKIIPIILNKFDIVLCENDWLGFPTYWIFSKVFKYKIIFEAHGILSEEGKNWGRNFIIIQLYKFIEKFCIKHSDLVIALSNEIKLKYERYNENIELIPVFIDTCDYKPIIKNNSKKIGIIGPFGSKRNMYYTPDFVYSNIHKFDEKIQFIIIGKCNKNYESFRIQKLGYINSFNEYMQSIAELDAIIVIEKRETSGPLNKILEAMACETPVFTTPEGALGLEKIENGKNIIISHERELVNKLNSLIFDEKELAFLSYNAKELFNNYYNVKANKKKIINSIRLISKKN